MQMAMRDAWFTKYEFTLRQCAPYQIRILFSTRDTGENQWTRERHSRLLRECEGFSKMLCCFFAFLLLHSNLSQYVQHHGQISARTGGTCTRDAGHDGCFGRLILAIRGEQQAERFLNEDLGLRLPGAARIVQRLPDLGYALVKSVCIVQTVSDHRPVGDLYFHEPGLFRERDA